MWNLFLHVVSQIVKGILIGNWVVFRKLGSFQDHDKFWNIPFWMKQKNKNNEILIFLSQISSVVYVWFMFLFVYSEPQPDGIGIQNPEGLS